MRITPVDQDRNLFQVQNIMPQDLVDAIVQTPWLDLDWTNQEGQERWPRRRIKDSAIPWIGQWNQICQQLWPEIAAALEMELLSYQGTAWWLDEPGFTCSLHTDGEMPGSMQLTWVGNANLGTAFYHYKDSKHLRYQFPFMANNGYIMINNANSQGSRQLQWHAMLNPVPANSYRLTSYSWMTAK